MHLDNAFPNVQRFFHPVRQGLLTQFAKAFATRTERVYILRFRFEQHTLNVDASESRTLKYIDLYVLGVSQTPWAQWMMMGPVGRHLFFITLY